MTPSEINASLAAMRPKMLRAARSILNGTRQFDVDTAAEDIVQDAMLSCWLNGTPTEANVYTMVYQRGADFLKAQDVRSWVVGMDMDKIADERPLPGSEVETDPRVMEIWKVLRLLSPALRDTFYRHYFEGDRQEEIAVKDGVSVETVAMRLVRSRRIVKDILISNKCCVSSQLVA